MAWTSFTAIATRIEPLEFLLTCDPPPNLRPPFFAQKFATLLTALSYPISRLEASPPSKREPNPGQHDAPKPAPMQKGRGSEISISRRTGVQSLFHGRTYFGNKVSEKLASLFALLIDLRIATVCNGFVGHVLHPTRGPGTAIA